ncbi:hypothetical protein evm_010250 [Chilo suppressalis]|nr:hypothetical protein evm_010250 [Chilo suppressalis]
MIKQCLSVVLKSAQIAQELKIKPTASLFILPLQSCRLAVSFLFFEEKLDEGARWRKWLARSAAIVEVKQLSQWSVIGWVTKNLLSRAPPCFGRHVKPLVPAASAVVNTHQSALGPRGGSWPNLPIPFIGTACASAVGTLIG